MHTAHPMYVLRVYRKLGGYQNTYFCVLRHAEEMDRHHVLHKAIKNVHKANIRLMFGNKHVPFLFLFDVRESVRREMPKNLMPQSASLLLNFRKPCPALSTLSLESPCPSSRSRTRAVSRRLLCRLRLYREIMTSASRGSHCSL